VTVQGWRPVHPGTGMRALGFTRRGLPIWPVRGGSDDAGAGNEGQVGEGGNSSDTPSAEDWKSKAEAQQKVNKDLERKGKADLRTIESLKQQLADLQAGSAPRSELETEVDKARKEAATEATAVANRKIVRAEIKAAASAKFADPADAIAFLNLDDFTVDDDGEVDGEAIMAALDDLLKKKPHLGAKGAARWSGSGDGGHRGEASVNVLPGIPRLAHAYATNEKSARS
jgi:hypothetical protein